MPTRTEVIAWACFFALGFGGWNVLNSLFLEAPYMVQRLPEGATLSTYLLIAQQIASLLVIVPTQFLGQSTAKYYVHIIVVTFIVSFISCIILMIWSLDSIGKFSLPFLLMAVITSMLGYISTTYYFPFVSLYKLYCTNAYTLGLGFSLAFTAIISLAQDSGSVNPRFGYRGFFGIILASQLIAFVGVCWILLSEGAKTQLVSYVPPENSLQNEAQAEEEPCKHQIEERNGVSMQEQQRRYETKYKPAPVGKKREFSSWRVFWHFILPSLWQGVLAFLAFGIVPSLLYYASGSYYNGDVIYMWSLSLLYIVDPIARVIYSLQIKEFGRTRHVNLLTAICLCFGFAICLLAGMSPDYTWARSATKAGAIPIILAICCGFTYAGAFTSSYTNMFNIGTEATEDEMYQLEIETDDKESGQENTTGGIELVATPATPSTPESSTTTAYSETEEAVTLEISKSPKQCSKGPCQMCHRDSIRRDALRQIIYRLAGFSLQIGSCVGTFTGASLTVFTTTIGDPVAFVPK